MYEFENVPEPMREGWWWPENACAPVFCWRRANQHWFVYSSNGKLAKPCYVCSDLRTTWTGPIPMPKAKPTPSEDEYICAACGKTFTTFAPCCRDGKLFCAWCYIHPSSEKEVPLSEGPSEDEGDALGRRLHDIVVIALTNLRTAPAFEGMPTVRQRRWANAALRFRAECVGPWKKAASAARAYVQRLGGDGTDGDGEDEYDELVAALSALPEQGEAGEEAALVKAVGGIDLSKCAAPAKTYPPSEEEIAEARGEHKPRPSDEELGRFAARESMKLLRVEGTYWPSPDEFAELGAAIRAKLLDTKDKQA